jgi:hypothetical protein
MKLGFRIVVYCNKKLKKAIPYMNFKSISILIGFIIVLSSCSKDENGNEVPVQQFKTITATSIAFVHEDGSALLQGECVNPDTNYAILIKTSSGGSGDFKTTVIEYTFNSITYQMSFSSDGEQMNQIKLIYGLNKAGIVGADYKTELYFSAAETFELLE